MEQLWNNLLGYFEQLAQTGKMAELELERKTLAQRLSEQGIAMWNKYGRNAISEAIHGPLRAMISLRRKSPG